MKWNTYHTNSIESTFVYRYLTLEKLIDFLETEELYLTRLDKFEDNLESISPYEINNLKIRSGLTTKPKIANPEIPDHVWDHLVKTSKTELVALKDRLTSKQKHRFVSCWILNNVESFGMWDIYGKSGFAIRFNRKYFQKLIKNSISLQKSPTTKIDLLIAGRVEYQNFDNMENKEKEAELKYSVFRKHLAFNHENEYRIVGFTKIELNKPGLRFKLPDLKDLDFEIFANPRLNSFQFDKYKSIINNYSKEHPLTESGLKTWLEFRNAKY